MSSRAFNVDRTIFGRHRQWTMENENEHLFVECVFVFFFFLRHRIYDKQCLKKNLTQIEVRCIRAVVAILFLVRLLSGIISSAYSSLFQRIYTMRAPVSVCTFVCVCVLCVEFNIKHGHKFVNFSVKCIDLLCQRYMTEASVLCAFAHRSAR